MQRLTSVLTAPGQTVFTRMGARSTASPRVNASTAPKMAEAKDHPGDGLKSAIPAQRLVMKLNSMKNERYLW